MNNRKLAQKIYTHLHLHGHCSVLATGNTTVTIHGSNNAVIANNSVQVITGSIRDNNTIVLNNKSVLSMTDLFESKSIITCQNVIILANDESLIEDYRFTSTGPTSPTIMLRDYSKIKIYNRLEKS